MTTRRKVPNLTPEQIALHGGISDPKNARLFSLAFMNDNLEPNMTMPDERTRAAVYAGAFLRDLLNPGITPGVPKDVRATAKWLLRHYPDPWLIEKAHEGAPAWWGPLPEQLHWRATREEK